MRPDGVLGRVMNPLCSGMGGDGEGSSGGFLESSSIRTGLEGQDRNEREKSRGAQGFQGPREGPRCREGRSSVKPL